ncbi:dorsal-ventral patterning tolloid-like protein 1 [Dreissena polymorpha]|uniref:dorsal-ventral patterning tolloid-like protein 1 n=1 Tax=Dreissena polymorpha TaxID=45954 RepID=UPI002263C1F6|nr:dorsal-ventral patterning tolloid-like protein 1 [Dreissena polymorpha]
MIMDLKFSLQMLMVFLFVAFFVGTYHASPLVVKVAKTVAKTRLRRQASFDVEFRADKGVIQLPTKDLTGKELYEANKEIKWKIKVPDGHHVVINSEYFDLEASSNCQYDYVLVVDGSRNNTFCDKEHLVYVSTSNDLTVTFVSDDDVSGKGFKFNLMTVPNSPEGKCNSTILAIQGQDGDIWNYDNPGNCFYSLEAPEGLTVQIKLKFIYFGSTSNDEKRIVIRDGVSTHGEHLWKISSGKPLLKESVCAKHLFIEYHNQGSTKATRFYFTYSVVTCTTEPGIYSPPHPFVEGDNDCGCNKQEVCVLQGFEKMCIPGSQCGVDLCENGATCVDTNRGDQCFCFGGFTGKFCNETAGPTVGHLKFIEVPQSRIVKTGGQSVSLCRVENPASREQVVYSWYFKNEAIGNYRDRTKLRDDEGLLLITDFNANFEGRYTCVARAGNLTSKHTITLSMVECFQGKLSFSHN